VPKLVAGFAYIRRGSARYKGALRVSAKAVPAWTCEHDHITPESARLCADTELEKRTQGGREVITLRRCGPCDRWWPDGPGQVCPACSVPLERVKLAVLERFRVP
jgi:hypothetical protein